MYGKIVLIDNILLPFIPFNNFINNFHSVKINE